MLRRWGFATAMVVTLAIGAAFRVPQIEQRPMHLDEAVQAYKTGQLLETGQYRYHPHEFHGPTLYYLTLPVLWAAGVEDFADSREGHYRVVPVVFGLGLVALLGLLGQAMGPAAAVCAGVLVAVSPAMSFYSRYYVQEMLLVLFTFGLLAAGWRYARSGRWGWALAGGVCLGLMHATKETCVIALGCMALALGWVVWWRGRKTGDTGLRGRMRPWRVPAAGIVAGAAVSMLFFSSFFTHPAGVLDSVRAFGYYLARSGGSGTTGLHDHPWHEYLSMLIYTHPAPGPWWSEGIIVALSVVGVVAALWGRGLGRGDLWGWRFIATYTVLMVIVYSAIPYKTPWNWLSAQHAMILTAGIGATALVRATPGRAGKMCVALLLAAGVFQLGLQARMTNFRYASDPRNPYVYAHTVDDVKRLARRVGQIAELHPSGRRMPIKVITQSEHAWPLPWYLRKYPNVSYSHGLPAECDAPVVINDMTFEAEVKTALNEVYQPEYYGLRPEVLLRMRIRQGLWDRWLDRQPPEAARAKGGAGP